MKKSDIKICVVGLGYVGLPLALEFGKKYNTIGFDINKERVDELSRYEDHTLEADPKELKLVMTSSDLRKGLSFTSKLEEIKDCNVYIVTVPTPINNF